MAGRCPARRGDPRTAWAALVSRRVAPMARLGGPDCGACRPVRRDMLGTLWRTPVSRRVAHIARLGASAAGRVLSGTRQPRIRRPAVSQLCRQTRAGTASASAMSHRSPARMGIDPARAGNPQRVTDGRNVEARHRRANAVVVDRIWSAHQRGSPSRPMSATRRGPVVRQAVRASARRPRLVRPLHGGLVRSDLR